MFDWADSLYSNNVKLPFWNLFSMQPEVPDMAGRSSDEKIQFY